MLLGQVHLTLPAWAQAWMPELEGRILADDADKVALAVELSRRNVEAGSGGPFGAAVFGPDHRLVSIGVNRVMPMSCSMAHAEIMAYALAQQRLQRARLNRDADDLPCGPFVLATSAQPCCQCFGATVWAGIDRLLIGARAEDVEALTTFDEGPLPADWVGELERRGITVLRDLQREAACAVLRSYGSGGGAHY
ncbi:MAG: nucleoside deaminase [Pseudoxanthomonas suwonensis]|nr:MAG: nucleoside deaminase [Pseudoxanthomonas suwonensis]